MLGRAAAPDKGLAAWLEREGLGGEEAGPGAIADASRVRSLLLVAAREGRALSYSDLLGQLGHRFTRPKMRALCRTLDAIDADGHGRGEPGLAVLVVRESDRLPGQGWWVGTSQRYGYNGEWDGPTARAFVREQQNIVFDYWQAASEPV